MKRIHVKHTTQSGQAIVEFLVATVLVMSVLFLAIAMLGKFNDVRNKTLMGSRYVAWERTVWSDSDSAKNLRSDPSTNEGWSATYGNSALANAKSDDDMLHEFVQRFVAANGAPITGADGRSVQLPASQQAMWNDYSGAPLLGSAQDIKVSSANSDSPITSLNQYTASSFGSVNTSSGSTFKAGMALPTRTLQSGTLSISVAQDNETLKRLWNGFSGVTFTDTNTLLTNTWLPEGTTNAKNLFTKAVPATAADPLVRPSLYTGLQKYAPEIGTTAKLEFGRVQQDIVPTVGQPDRFKAP